ncbi:MAG TPA: MBL fold metallo-hydrolase, partial [Gemmataceae bacterium]|nr:MBL fold metallo-hydrolase [Gemmataceae bacterium]
LVARRPDGSFPAGPELSALHRDLLAERVTFTAVLGRLGATIHAGDFAPAGSFVTPPFTPVRFDSSFYVAHLPPGQHAEVVPGELDEGRWATAADLLECWRRGECLVSPPTLLILQAVRGRPIDEVPTRIAPHAAYHASGAIPPIFYAPHVQLAPLFTDGLPPATHTNAYLVGAGPAYLIDPGASDPDEQRRLFDLIDVQQALGRRLAAVVLTHHHPDHVGAAAAAARQYGVPVWAHRLTARALEGKVAIAHFIEDGDRLDLGPCPDGGGPWHLEALWTPGHASGHLAFWEPRYRFVFAGDLVSMLSSVVIAPPDGDLALYLDSLRRLRGLPSRLLLPGHGSPSTRPAAVLDEALAHRAKREEQLLEALQAGPRKVPELAVELYRGLPANLMRFAEMQVVAGLYKLRQEGRAEEVADGPEPAWRLRAV